MPPVKITFNLSPNKKQSVIPFDRTPPIVTYGIAGTGVTNEIVKLNQYNNENAKKQTATAPSAALDQKLSVVENGARKPVTFTNRPLISAVNFGLLFSSAGMLQCLFQQPVRGAYSILAGASLYGVGRIMETKQRDQEQMSFINLYSEY